MKPLFCVCAVLFLLSTYGQETDKSSDLYKIYHSSVELKKNSPEAARTLVQLSKETKIKEVKSPLIKTVTLMLLRARSKGLGPYMEEINSSKSTYLKFLQKAPFQKQCYKCKGKGFLESSCKRCRKGVCMNCKGKKSVSYRGLGGKTEKKDCPTCNASGICRECDGSDKLKAACLPCNEKGSFFTDKAVPAEYRKSLAELIELTAMTAIAKKVDIGLEESAIAKLEAKRQKIIAARQKAAEEKRRKAEMARLEKSKRQMAAQQGRENNQAVEEASGDNIEALNYAVMEVKNYIDAQEKRTKSELFVKVYGKFNEGKPTLYLQVAGQLMKSKMTQRSQILDGFKRFWKLRASQNGLGETVDYKPYYNNKVIKF